MTIFCSFLQLSSAALALRSLKENHQTPKDLRMSDNTTTLAPPAPNQGPTTPRKGPPKFKQRQTRQFKSKPPKKGVKGFGDDIPGMEGLGTDITVICPWEAFSHLELHELAQFGII
ncbi:retinal cone rhodopsin-sensitive cGMP 3',5'-cyclic phosphodiesterase subunit gamma isoform X1 [Suricata suricatta]|uniref:Retinal cone rhodopsin-sensitive cGMP 3',5'-cyclic phosphodiesterase subunit gamma n=1 Tax=Suricata suricatta TaxID=37032 RepID=A0A673TDJ9_SURSU|nr:retinal cone rhodopsin-sensitive cGMP 3',5'-cyclic phosphodiesterase subunit gamma isoform X1 [Suricata suricatta]